MAPVGTGRIVSVSRNPSGQGFGNRPQFRHATAAPRFVGQMWNLLTRRRHITEPHVPDPSALNVDDAREEAVFRASHLLHADVAKDRRAFHRQIGVGR